MGTTTATPVLIFRCVMAKNNNVDGYTTRKGAEKAAGRQGYVGDLTTFEVVERDGLFYVEAVTEIHPPASDTTMCVDCGAEVPTIATGLGAFDLPRCPVMEERKSHSRGHHVSRDVFEKANGYARAAQIVAAGSDARYSVKGA